LVHYRRFSVDRTNHGFGNLNKVVVGVMDGAGVMKQPFVGFNKEEPPKPEPKVEKIEVKKPEPKPKKEEPPKPEPKVEKIEVKKPEPKEDKEKDINTEPKRADTLAGKIITPTIGSEKDNTLLRPTIKVSDASKLVNTLSKDKKPPTKIDVT
jgi:outer membrane biosynthesis protein TonB